MVGIIVEMGRNLQMHVLVHVVLFHGPFCYTNISCTSTEPANLEVPFPFFSLPPCPNRRKGRTCPNLPFLRGLSRALPFFFLNQRLILSDKHSSSAIVTALNTESLSELFLTSSLPKPSSSLTRGTTHSSLPSWEDSAYSSSCCRSYPAQLP
jgi:hypothetical protein